MNIDDFKKKLAAGLPGARWGSGIVVQAGKQTAVSVLFDGDHTTDGRLKLAGNPEDPIPGYGFMGDPASTVHAAPCELELDAGETLAIFITSTDGRFTNQGPAVKK